MIDKSTYYVGYPKYFLTLQKLRSIEVNAAFLVPYLQDNISLLDCGCGLGSITLGFAGLLKNSKIVGVDTEQSLLDMGITEAKHRGITNAHFQLGNILKLPFPDNYFDIVFEHSLLLHLSEYKDIGIKEMLRVLKPGGIIAVREIDFDTLIFFPYNEILKKALDFRLKMFLDNGVDYHMGRKLRYLFNKAKVEYTYFTASSVIVDNDKSLSFAGNYFASELRDLIFIEQMIKDGKISSTEIAIYQNEWRKFPETQGAFMQYTWSEAVGYKR